MRVVIAGGGTGGHFFPGLAIAREFTAKNSGARVLFISTGNPFERSTLAKTGYPMACIRAEGIKGKRFHRKVRAILKIPTAIFSVLSILKDFRPDLVIGVGGYSSAPVVLGAWLLRVRIAICEQNKIPGITNRLLSYVADRIYVSFPDTKIGKNQAKAHFTGNPVRQEILSHPDRRLDPEEGPGTAPFTVLVMGGSQGAHAINMAILGAISYLKEKKAYKFIHQTGPFDAEMVAQAYLKSGISAAVAPFFEDMARQYQRADLVICRAGATTVAELTAGGKGSLLIPFPFAADNHQVSNARSLSDRGAAEMILQKDLTPQMLADRIAYYAFNPDALRQLGRNAKRLGNPDAAGCIVKDCYNLVGP
ncbi:MAG: undecaprenyldiphospho-muramoylpentapeptide beta-N-acetylglucosaminyltransferase [Desulfobacterales bacterium]|nr:undecaprenyldiphospho-muramoylpentapeptide beta-N-acetylglucosaminyltransferase [Desulfobacterales bacterium]